MASQARQRLGNLRRLNCQIQALRPEIITSRNTHSNVLQWELILVAAPVAVGLGFSPNTSTQVPGAEYLLGMIAFVCAYVDLLLWHNALRILNHWHLPWKPRRPNRVVWLRKAGGCLGFPGDDFPDLTKRGRSVRNVHRRSSASTAFPPPCE
jgi:hypothetical protein